MFMRIAITLLQDAFVLQALRNAMGIVGRGHDGDMGLGVDKVFE